MNSQFPIEYRKIVFGELTHEQIQRAWDDSLELGVRWVFPGDPDYPAGWKVLNEPGGPKIFCYKGNPVWRTSQLISIVGSRTPMRETCQWMQRELAKFCELNDVTVVSGGARGVDQWSHRIAMDSGRPTVCVFPAGLRKLYPYGFGGLFERILETGGAWVSTFGLDEGMRKHMFLERNRWIAGFSPVTFVVEANRRSGSSLTAGLAQAEERALCTLPVFPFSYQGLGNLDLLASDRAHMIRDHIDLSSVLEANRNMFQGRLTI